MNDKPPMPEPPENIDEQYRRASATDTSRPSDWVRSSVLAHAAQLAAERSRAQAPRAMGRARAARPRRWWWPAAIGTVAAAVLAGLLIAPHLYRQQLPGVEPQSLPDVASASDKARVLASPPGMSAPSSSAPATSAPAILVPAPKPATRVAQNPVADQAPVAAEAEADASVASVPARADKALARREAVASSAQMGAAAVATAAPPAAAPVDINARDARGRTALMLAILNGQADVVDSLLAQGADPNAADADGVMPLQAAISRGNPRIVAALKKAQSMIKP